MLVTEIDGCKAVQWHVRGARFSRLHAGELLHWGLAAIGLEGRLAPHPFCALFGNRSLGELVAQLNLELAAVQAALTIQLRDVELFSLFADLVGNLVGNERWRGEDEVQLVEFFQLSFQRFECIHRKTRRCDTQAGTGF